MPNRNRYSNRLKARDILSYLFGILLLAFIAAKILGHEDYETLIRNLSSVQIAVSLFIAFLLFFINGYTIAFLTVRQNNVFLKRIDMVILPFMMHLWSFIIPFRGGLLFSAFFLRMKYNIKGTEGVAIGVYTTLVSFMMTGLCGVYFTYQNHRLFSLWTLISLILVGSPAILYMMDRVCDSFVFKSPSLLHKLKQILSSVISSTRKLLADHHTSIGMFCLTLASVLLYVLFLLWITTIFKMDASLVQIVMFALMMRLSTLIRIVPGNLGIQELFTGSTYYLTGGRLDDGLAIALFIRLLALSLTLSVGTIGFFSNLKYFQMGELKKVWQELTKPDVTVK